MEQVAVIGSGTMGNGIAHVFAQSGFKVNLVDISQDALNKALKTIEKNLDRMLAKDKIDEVTKTATLSNISTYTEMNTGVGTADLVVEAATENVEIKLKIFEQLEEAAKPECILRI